MIDGNKLFNISGMECQYDKLPAICKDLIPTYQDVAFKYTLIIIVGLLNLLAMSYFAFLIRRYIKAKMAETGAKTFGELIELLKKK